MAHLHPTPVSIDAAMAGLTFLGDRTPFTTPDQSHAAFAQLADYRDGGVFIGDWAGTSEWERHARGDEIVMIMDGSTTIVFQSETGETSAQLRAGHLVIVPEGTWHRFETPDRVKVLTVTPQPTDHATDRPS